MYKDAVEAVMGAIVQIEMALYAVEDAIDALKEAGITQRAHEHAIFSYSRLQGVMRHLEIQRKSAQKALEILASEQETGQ